MNSNRYNFKKVEEKWQKFWDQNKTFSSKVDINKKNSYLKCSFSMSHQIGYYFSLEPFDYDSLDINYFDGDEEWDFDYEGLLCEYYGVEELIEM